MPNWSSEEVAEMLKGDLDPGVKRQLAGVVGAKVLPVPGPSDVAVVVRQSEASHQVKVINLLHKYGWRVCEFRKARIKKDGVDVYRTPFGADGAGFPDLFAVRPPRAMLIEDKTDEGAAAPNQVAWLLLCGKCPQLEVKVVRPQDMAAFEEAIK